MSGSIVNVLTPHGRRQNVKVQPNTAILKVLEEVCEKYKFDANEYDLRHHKRVLDLTTSFRFSGLPNNAQLEMIEAQKKRQDTEVDLVIQIGDGKRLDGKFKPNTTLLDIIQQLCRDELTGTDLFAIYMRTEVASDKLGDTSLKDLGLISGRAIIRLVHRDPNAAKIQANVALNLQTKATKDEDTQMDEEDRENKIRKTNDATTMLHSVVQQFREEQKVAEKLTQQDSTEEKPSESSDVLATSSGSVQQQGQDVPMIASSSVEPQQAVAMDIQEEESEEDIGEIHILGERNAVLFTQDAATKANLNDVPDSFFDLNVNDLKLLIKDLRTEGTGTVDQPLMTAKLREMEEEQKQLSMLNRYKTVIIRVQFPNRYVLQGTFTPYETIGTVTDFVRLYLANPDINFHLYTTPPKTILSDESRLFEASCVPSAILHFGSDEKITNYLKEDILDKVSSPKASLVQALLDRGIKSQALDLSVSQQVRKSNVSSEFAASKSTTSSSDAKLPKWFKSFGK